MLPAMGDFLQIAVTGVLGLIVSSLRSYVVTNMDNHSTQFKTGVAPQSVYDFIVVGSGCGGSVVASRLSETSASVLLLEAGDSAPPEAAVPGLWPLVMLRDNDWYYHYTAQRNGMFGYHNNSCKVSTGKSMGGSSTLNGQVYFRGNRRDFDNWARLGNTGWDYASVLPYFKKSESYGDHLVPVSAEYHGFNGPLGVVRKKVGPILDAFLKAGRDLGYKTVDSNGVEQLGFTPSYLTTKNGTRSSASEAFLVPSMTRRNLDIRTRATVQRVIFDSTKRAVGVEYVVGGQLHTVKARKEVILSAGAYESPKLLLLSGVGPRAQLEKLGIPVVAAVEGVGRNYHGHPAVYLPFSVKQGTATTIQNMIRNLPTLKEYMRTREGYFSDTFAGDGFAWVKLGPGEDSLWTDAIIDISSTSLAAGGQLSANSINMKKEIFDDIYGSLAGRDSASILVFLARPKSRGTLTLMSANPADSPVIDANVFGEKEDLELMRKAVRMSLDIINTPGYRKDLEARSPRKLLTPCSHHGRDSDGYWDCFSQQTVLQGSHAAGTVKMAPDGDPMGVVSPRLSVRGVSGLRVIDASVMPEPVTANTMGPTYMVGEKGADMIKEDWGYPTERLM